MTGRFRPAARLLVIALLCVAAVTVCSCRRRPLLDADYTVHVVLDIDTNIVNYSYPGDPSLMRVAFYDHSDGHLMTQAFLPAAGGDVVVIPGRTYDVLAYNFDTEVTIIEDGDDFDDISATTNTISEAFKSKLKSRGTKTPEETKGEETIVYDPDHLYVGRLTAETMPLRSPDSPEVTLSLDCKTVVESWIVEVDRVQGAQYVGSVSAVITGLSRYNAISAGLKSSDYASVFFDVQSLDRSSGLLTARFNTFGYVPGLAQILSLVITDTSGKGYIFNVDVSDQFPDNPEQIIRVRTDDIIIPEPEDWGSGGFAPVLDEWKDIFSRIEI